jgi:hypothetical protein
MKPEPLIMSIKGADGKLVELDWYGMSRDQRRHFLKKMPWLKAKIKEATK